MSRTFYVCITLTVLLILLAVLLSGCTDNRNRDLERRVTALEKAQYRISLNAVRGYAFARAIESGLGGNHETPEIIYRDGYFDVTEETK